MTNEFEENVFEVMDDLRGDNRVAVPDVGTIRRRAGRQQARMRTAMGAACLAIIGAIGFGIWASNEESPATTETAGIDEGEVDVSPAVADDSAPFEIDGPIEINSQESFGDWMLANRLRDDRTPFLVLTARDSDPTTDGVRLHLSAFPLDGSFEFFAVVHSADCGPLKHGMIEFDDDSARFASGRMPDSVDVGFTLIGYDCTPPQAGQLNRLLFREFEIVPTATGLRLVNDTDEVALVLTDLEGSPTTAAQRPFLRHGGDCMIGDLNESPLTNLPCDDPHDFELYREALIGGSVTEVFDEVAIRDYADEVCATSLEAYVTGAKEKRIDFISLHPTEASWNNAEEPDRTVQCVLYSLDGQLVGRASG